MIDAQPIPRGMTVLEAYKRFGYVPPMKGAAGDAAAGTAEAAPEGQGNGQGGLYQEALSGVPTELQPFVEEHFKKWDASVTPKLQEAADLKKRLGPIGEIEGLTDVDPQELQQLLAFRQVLADPEQLRGWIGQVAEALEMPMGQQDLSEDDWVRLGEEKGWFEGGGEGEPNGAPDIQAIIEQVKQAISPDLEPVKQFMGNQQAQQQAEQTKQQFASRLAELEKQHGELDEKANESRRQAVFELAWAFLDDEDPIGKGFQRYLEITGGAQGDLVDQRLQQPDPAVNGGRPATSPPSFNGIDDPNLKQAALARLKGS